jgi:hypothetical protein
MTNLKIKQRFVVTHGGDSYYNEGGYEEFKELANLDLNTIEKTAKKLAKAYLNMEATQRWVKVSTIIEGEIYTLEANAVHVMPTRRHVDSAELI